MIYTPSAAQAAMLEGLVKRPRTQLVAGMGTGKTGALIVHACSTVLQYGRFPGMLVLAPPLVCLAWAREIPNWAPHLRVALLLGSSVEKAAAMRGGADIYLMNYEGLPWLHGHVKGSWGQFARIIACDESTKIKKTRASWRTSSLGKRYVHPNGGVNTNALAKHVADFDYWTNATGTVAPNGVDDLWGQYWYIDGGRRLGASHSDFEQRFMYNAAPFGEYPKYQPVPGAMEEIARLVGDVTTTVRTEDYYDLAQPFTVRRELPLPDAARRMYNELSKTLTLELDKDTVVTVESASAKTRKLLQVASGFVYNQEVDEALETVAVRVTQLHSVKLQAIESILEETDEPLVVVFYHHGFAQALKAKFKDQVELIDSSNFNRVQDTWNAGRLRILAFQYERGAYGLSLQHGGRNICFAEPTYISDHYSQAIERIGPMRQAQSGYNRSVNVFQLCAENTHDSRVFDVALGKISVEQALTLAVRDASATPL